VSDCRVRPRQSAAGTYEFDSSNNLVQTSATGGASGTRSQYYADRLVAGIASEKTITLSVGKTVNDPQTGKPIDIDAKLGGGVTAKTAGGNAHVTVTGNSVDYLRDKAGNPLKMDAPEVVMHELLGHAIPYVTGEGTGSAIGNENIARGQIPRLKQRENEPGHPK
jgi:hypothetical protein